MKLGLIIILIFCSFSVLGQQNDTLSNVIVEEITLLEIRSLKSLPWTFKSDSLKLPDAFQPTLRNIFQSQPGMLSFNAENFAQDIRISIRGFGSRSAFGIRGIKMYQDGIPLTTPDGTTQMDEVSVFDVNEMDYIRSGLSARLGNSAGGTIALKSVDYFNGYQMFASGSQFGAVNLGAKHGFQVSRLSNVLSVNHHYFVGKRQYASAQNTTLYNKTKIFMHDKWELQGLIGAYFSPIGDDPGALTRKEFETDPYQSNYRNYTFQAGENVKGLLLAGISKYFLNDKCMLLSKVYYRKRNFEAQLPFEVNGWVQLKRDFIGMSNVIEYNKNKAVKWTLGQLMEYQNDQRKLSNNILGVRGDLMVIQDERVVNIGFFQHAQWSIKKWNFHQLLRWDLNVLNIYDKFLSNGIQDGHRTFRNFNGSFGISYDLLSSLKAYANVNTSFEMPTLNELSNNPLSDIGFNASLKPEKSLLSEFGVRANISKHWKAQTTFFYIEVADQLIGYEQTGKPGKTYYRNAGKTKRIGNETTITYRKNNIWMDMNYTWSNFKYNSYLINNDNFAGNTQPLIPKHKASLRFGANMSKYLIIDLLFIYNTSMWFDDANTDQSGDIKELQSSIFTSPNLLSNFQFGIQINNVLGWQNYSNFRANAAFKRYYEAASPMYLGIFIKGSWNKI